jgi:uncharacterized protein YndB with AHSA1/START domain
MSTENAKALSAKVRLGLPRGKVFEMLSQAEHLERWFCEYASVDLAGGEYSFWGIHTPGAPETGEGVSSLLGSDAGSGLRFGWEIRGANTEVEYELTEDGDATVLTVRHANLPDRAEHEGAIHDFWYVALENLRLYAATGEQQFMVDYRCKKGPEIVVSIDVAGPPEAVWEKFANMEQMNRYYGQGATLEPRVGGKVDYGWGPDCGPVKVLDIVPDEKLSYSWHYRDEPDTVVTWSLAESGGRTRLTITHSGFADDYESEGYRAGWFSFLSIIKGMVELGEDWEMVAIEGMAHGDA